MLYLTSGARGGEQPQLLDREASLSEQPKDFLADNSARTKQGNRQEAVWKTGRKDQARENGSYSITAAGQLAGVRPTLTDQGWSRLFLKVVNCSSH